MIGCTSTARPSRSSIFSRQARRRAARLLSARAARAAPPTPSTGLNPAPIRLGFGRACDPVGDAEEESDYEILRSGFDELAGIVARHQRELDAYVARQRVRFRLDEAEG